MKASTKCLTIVAAVVLVGLFIYGNGCKKSEPSAAAGTDSVSLCTDCGQIKGGELCCQPNQPKCPKCDLVKGSPGCCKISKDAKTAAICTKCGQIKGGDLCCKPNQTKCPKCGLVKGSPGCCKIPKAS